ncbi:putative dihydrolipoamide acetyltransferase [gamma proteobacterium HdN1]|nr:putative dihydrolipoamide acetyltransferase [gamma proteobacterium HdN1]
MKYFKLPDLGEGLQEAEIVEWHVKAGDAVHADQLIVSVETAKAIVEVPTPKEGVIAAVFGKPGDLVHIGEPLVEYVGEGDDEGTVVGKMERAGKDLHEDHFIIGSAHAEQHGTLLATPAIRALAKRLGVELSEVNGTGRHGMVTSDDVEKAARIREHFGDATPLRGVRRSMAKNMALAHAEVAKVCIVDDADVHTWFGSGEDSATRQDPTLRLIRAIGVACEKEPNVNAWFDGKSLSLRVIEKVDLGIAVDTPDGLFVPVLRNIRQRAANELREGLDKLRADVQARTIPPQEMMGATISLSNYGTLAGRYADPVVVPPMVAIIGAGKIRQQVVAHQGQVTIHPVMPLSLSFDHRAITGGEAARFLRALMDDMQLAN